MHISEGVLSPAALGGGWILASAGIAVGLRRSDYARLAAAAAFAAVFFMGSLIHVPLGPGSVHLMLNGLLGFFLGWAVFPALLVAMTLQAILLRQGGLAVLGVNVALMAIPGLMGHYAFRRWPRPIGPFCCGAFSVAGAALLAAAALRASHEGFAASAYILMAAHAPVALLEGVITAVAAGFMAKARPNLREPL